jgi:uncharacterized membrane protein (DUF485 family)
MAEEADGIRTHTDEELERLARKLMRQQASLSIKVAVVFVALLVLLPLFNLFFPRLANANVGGFTVSWLFLGILFFPITWLLSQYFVRQSDQIEAEEAADWKRDMEGKA